MTHKFHHITDSKAYWKKIIMLVKKAQPAGQTFRIAASGGSSANIFDHLNEAHFNYDQVDLFQVDERCISQNHKHSNYQLLANKCGQKVQNFFFFDTTLYPDEAAAEYVDHLQEDKEGYLFDLTILGVGPDGHIASLFPGVSALDEEQKLTAHTTTNVFDVHERVTLTLPALKKSRKILVLMIGTKKKDIWEKITKPSTEKLPAHRLLSWDQVEWWWLNQ